MSAIKKYLTTKEAATLFGLSVSAFEKGRLGFGRIRPPYVKIGRAVRYEYAALIGWAHTNGIVAGQPMNNDLRAKGGCNV